MYTLISFILTIPFAIHENAFYLEPRYYGLIAIKSFVIFLAWILSFTSIKKMALSTYGVLDLSRVLFATFLGVTVLGEVLSMYQVIGLILVGCGLMLLPVKKRKESANTKIDTERPDRTVLYVLAAFASCLLNALSGLMDKLYMKDVTSTQLQFWYMLYLVLFYLIYILIRHVKISLEALKNGWIYLLSILFVIADKCLFIANGMADSRITVMTLIKQSGCIVTILAGKFIFREKDISHKLLCAAIIIAGIVIAVL